MSQFFFPAELIEDRGRLRSVAGVLGKRCTEQAVLGMLVQLHGYVDMAERDTFTGSPGTAVRVVERIANWGGRHGALVSAFCDAGYLLTAVDRRGVGYRVTHVHPETARRIEARRSAGGAR